jgi:hypothetical protein
MHREHIKKSVINILKSHVGKANAISANQLYCMVTGETLYPAKASNKTRIIRSVIREIRARRELPILSGNGYWLAETDEELKLFVEKRIKTATRIFGLSRELSGIPIDRMVEQLKLELEKEENSYEQTKESNAA